MKSRVLSPACEALSESTSACFSTFLPNCLCTPVTSHNTHVLSESPLSCTLNAHRIPEGFLSPLPLVNPLHLYQVKCCFPEQNDNELSPALGPFDIRPEALIKLTTLWFGELLLDGFGAEICRRTGPPCYVSSIQQSVCRDKWQNASPHWPPGTEA